MTRKFFLASQAIVALSVSAAAAAQIDFSTDFEEGATAVSDNWTWGANQFDDAGCTAYNSSYGYYRPDFAAPDAGPQVSSLSPQFAAEPDAPKQMVFYSDYNNAAFGGAADKCVEVRVFREVNPITADDVGVYQFKYETTVDSLDPADAARAGAVIWLNDAPAATGSALPAGAYTVDFEITDAMVGGKLQYGFFNKSSNYQDTGVKYDNVSFAVPAPAGGGGGGGGGAAAGGDATAVPALPVGGLLGLIGLIGLMGLRRKL